MTASRSGRTILFREQFSTVPNGQQLEELCALVLRDRSLQDKLRQSDDHEAFVARVVEEGDRRGVMFTAADVWGVIRANRHALLLRRLMT
jgi:hypothetical protein